MSRFGEDRLYCKGGEVSDPETHRRLHGRSAVLAGVLADCEQHPTVHNVTLNWRVNDDGQEN